MKSSTFILFVSVILFTTMFATAQQTNTVTRFPTNAANIQTQPAGKLWTNLQNVRSLNNGAATVSLAQNGICTVTKCYRSAYLQADHFGFNLTTNDVVVGIEINVRLKASVANSVKTLRVGPYSPNNILCCDEDGNTLWLTQYQLRTYGGPNKTWGILCCDPGEGDWINAPDFGMRISVENLNPSSPVKATIDYVSMTIYYTTNSGARIMSQTRKAGMITETRSESWLLYPNPAGNNLKLKSFSDVSNAMIKIFNTQGQLVFQKNISDINKNESTKIETALFKRGVYLLQMISQDGIETKRFVKD